MTLVVDKPAANGTMEPARLYEPPFTDHSPSGVNYVFPDADVDLIVAS